jgi:hypothetical protein
MTEPTNQNQKHKDLLESVHVLLDTISLLNQAIDQENANGFYNSNESVASFSDDDASSRSSSSNKSTEPDFLSVLPVVQMFVRESGFAESPLWKTLSDRTTPF